MGTRSAGIGRGSARPDPGPARPDLAEATPDEAALDRARPGVGQKEDGRARRSRTTRRAVAEAYLDLLDAGDLRPTARAIAAQAGVSERAVFRHFQDMETLHSEAAVLQIQRVGQDIPGPVAATGSLRDRIAGLATRWCTLNERVTPVRRVALLQEPFSPEIARRLTWVRNLARSEIETIFAAEFAAVPDGTRRRLIAALAVAVSWETWNELRSRQEFDPAAGAETVVAMMTAVLESFPSL